MQKLFDSIASLFRALIMLAILGGIGYFVIEHTPALEVARKKFSEWQNRPVEYDWGGGAAPAFGEGSPADAATAPVDPTQPAVVQQASNDPTASIQAAGFETPLAGSGVGTEAKIDDYVALERRLRQMGATYSLLESWGQNGDHFRFHCRVPMPGGGDTPQRFEAVGSTPTEAMQNVVAEVDRWRSFRGAATE